MTTNDSYAADQCEFNVEKLNRYILPHIQRSCGDSGRILDMGCGVGVMVNALREAGYDAYGADLPNLHQYWQQNEYDIQWFFEVEANELRLPFPDNHFDCIFSIGVIEHVGTSDGHADRMPDYHRRRQQWLLELYRVLRPQGMLLLGGPNRRFPVDTCHGLDTKASWVEQRVSRWARVSVHKPWGDNFLWGYADVHRYLDGKAYTMQPQSIEGLMNFSRVPGLLRSLARAYVKYLPGLFLQTGLNPWMMAKVIKTEQQPQTLKCEHGSWAALKADFSRDIDRYIAFSGVYKTQRSRWREVLSSLLIPQLQCTFLYRLAHLCHARGWRRIGKVLAGLNTFLFKVQIPASSCIGGGLYIPHPVSVVFVGVAGKDLTLYAGSACFNPAHDNQLGDDVSLGAVATVVQSNVADKVKIGFDVDLHKQSIEPNKHVVARQRFKVVNHAA